MIHATLLVISVLSAAPEDLRAATRALNDLQYEVALKRLPAESAIKAYQREEVIEWFSTRALTLLGLKREEEAADLFRRLFSIAPEWVLPDQYGPRVSTLVGAARAAAEEKGTLSLRFEGGLLRATKDPWGYGQQLELSWRAPNNPVTTVTLPLVESQPPPWPRDLRLEVWGRVLGLDGSTLVAWGSEPAPTRIEPLPVVSVAAPTATPAARPWVGAVVVGAGAAAVVTAALGAGFAVGSQDAQRAAATASRDADGRITSLTQRAAFALDTRVRSDAGVATALFVSTAVLVAAGAGLVLFDRLSAVPAPGGAALVVPLDAHFAFAGVEARR